MFSTSILVYHEMLPYGSHWNVVLALWNCHETLLYGKCSCHYENMPMQYTEFLICKNGKFSVEIFGYFS